MPSSDNIIVNKKFYSIHYLWQRTGHHVNIKNFETGEPSFQKVIARAQKHCELMGYRHIRTTPMISDLDKDEAAQENREVSLRE